MLSDNANRRIVLILLDSSVTLRGLEKTTFVPEQSIDSAVQRLISFGLRRRLRQNAIISR